MNVIYLAGVLTTAALPVSTAANELRALLRRRRLPAVATAMLFGGLTLFATLDTAAAGARSGTDNRASAPRTATTATNRVSRHIDVINENKAPLGDATRCKSRRCLLGHTH